MPITTFVIKTILKGIEKNDLIFIQVHFSSILFLFNKKLSFCVIIYHIYPKFSEFSNINIHTIITAVIKIQVKQELFAIYKNYTNSFTNIYIGILSLQINHHKKLYGLPSCLIYKVIYWCGFSWNGLLILVNQQYCLKG